MEEPCVSHLQGVKRILYYIKGTLIDGNFMLVIMKWSLSDTQVVIELKI